MIVMKVKNLKVNSQNIIYIIYIVSSDYYINQRFQQELDRENNKSENTSHKNFGKKKITFSMKNETDVIKRRNTGKDQDNVTSKTLLEKAVSGGCCDCTCVIF